MTPKDWLFLIHRVPSKPLYLRARIRTLLARAGAAPLKKAVYALPQSEPALARLQAVADEIRRAGGEAFVCEARFTSAEDEAALESAFHSHGGRQVKSETPRWTGRRWVTRAGILVDRIACAWFIRRFLDPSARIRFAPPPHTIRGGELGFDMPGGAFSHEDGGCSLETLITRTGFQDAALTRVARIVHELDIRDGRYEVPEARGVEQLLAGIVAGNVDDAGRLERGMALLDDLYRSFGAARIAVPKIARSPIPRRRS